MANKVQLNFTTEQVMKAQMGSIGIALLFKIESNDIQQMHFSMFIIYIYKHSYMFRPLWAIFRELYTVEYDLVVKQYVVNIKLYVVRVLS
jgi:hypothetical protein